MRIGYNETKDVPSGMEIRRHRIIMPVYIPHLEGYYAHLLEILHMSLESLRATVGDRAHVTLVANACAPEVLDDLNNCFRAGAINRLVINTENYGRIDAVLSAARGSFEEILTLSDSDVLFKPGWLDTVEQLFQTFPECGMASIVPHPGMGWHHTSATILGALLRRELAVDKAVSDEDIDCFARSINNLHWLKPAQRASQIVVRRNGIQACVGSGHFLITIRRELLDCLPKEPCLKPLGAGSDERWYDRPLDEHGYWRLASPQAYAYHMGNIPEPWMYDELRRWTTAVPPQAAEARSLPPPRRSFASIIPWRARLLLTRALRKAGLAGALRQRTSSLKPRAVN